MTLRQFLTDRKTKKIKRGALARVSEHLGVNKTTVKRWANGEWTPSIETAQRIQNMIHARISLAPLRTGKKSSFANSSKKTTYKTTFVAATK